MIEDLFKEGIEGAFTCVWIIFILLLILIVVAAIISTIEFNSRYSQNRESLNTSLTTIILKK